MSSRRKGNTRVLRPALSLKSDNIQPTAQSSYQADCFTPKQTLKRTPPKNLPVTVSSSDVTTKTQHQSPTASRNDNCTATSTPKRVATKQSHARRSLRSSVKRTGRKEQCCSGTTTPTRKDTQDDLNQSGGHLQERRVQAACFTPSHSLKRSPPSTPMKLDTPSHDDQEDLIDVAPPQTHWELPRTPPIHVHHVQVDPLRSTRKTPSVHPLSRSTRATPNKTTPLKSVIPSECMTENDLAFLQEMKCAQQRQELQDKSNRLEKALKTAAQQKELLQHQALKIDQDIEDMRNKYQETLTSVHTLIASSNFNSQDSPTSKTKDVEGERLTGGHIAQLKKMNQLASAQLEKTGHELKGKLFEVGKKKEELECQIRQCEEKQKDQLLKMESKIQSTQIEKNRLEETVKKTSEEHASVQAQIQQLQSTLEKLSIGKENEKERSRPLSQLEKQRVEKRLQRIIRRCELYVKRHEMLKEMGIR